MNQTVASPAVDSPVKTKKHFCFATIPFILIALSCLYLAVERIVYASDETYCSTNLDIIIEVLFSASFILHFVGAVIITVLLFAKQNNFITGFPLLLFSAGHLIWGISHIPVAYNNFYNSELFQTLSESLDDRFIFIIVDVSASAAFFAVALYSFIALSKKKAAPKILWIIPAILFLGFIAPLSVYNIFEFFDITLNTILDFEDFLWSLSFYPYWLMPWLSQIAIILFLIWTAFLYKKQNNSVQK